MTGKCDFGAVQSTKCLAVTQFVFENCFCGHSEEEHEKGRCFACFEQHFENDFKKAMTSLE